MRSASRAASRAQGGQGGCAAKALSQSLVGHMCSFVPEGCVGAVCVLASSMGVYGTYTDRFSVVGMARGVGESYTDRF